MSLTTQRRVLRRVGITRKVFVAHIRPRVEPSLQTFRAYKRAHPEVVALFEGPRFLTVQ